jgi:ectoine hydroxylase-related dioxygenase (phytanoyl-CoA dioxygenase family)
LNKIETHLENIDRLGYTIVEDVISSKECEIISEKLDKIDEDQVKEFGIEKLVTLREKGIIRALIEKDEYFSNLILNPNIFEIVSAILGDTAILHLQNGIVVYPEVKHGQSHFHRDFAKDFVSSKPLSVNAFWIIDDFNSETGATWIVPHTHKSQIWPSNEYLEKNEVQVEAKAGSVFIFDSMLIHRGGNNKIQNRRRAVNHQFTRPFIKQQIDFPILLKGRYEMESKLSQVLGFWTIPPGSVNEFRCDPDKRTYRSGQG